MSIFRRCFNCLFGSCMKRSQSAPVFGAVEEDAALLVTSDPGPSYSSTDNKNESTWNLDLLFSGSYLYKSPSGQKSKKPQKPRPTHFLAVKIDNPQIIESISKLQDEMIEKEAEVKSALIPTSKLHVTLSVLNLPNREDVTSAIECLSNIDWNLKGQKIPPLKLTGIGNFRNSVVFADFADDEGSLALKELAKATTNALKSTNPACLMEEETPEKDSPDANKRKKGKKSGEKGNEFTPHVTIAKVTAAKFKKKGKGKRKIVKIKKDCYSHSIDVEFGVQHWNSFQLLAMQWPKGEKSDGYYFMENEFSLSDS